MDIHPIREKGSPENFFIYRIGKRRVVGIGAIETKRERQIRELAVLVDDVLEHVVDAAPDTPVEVRAVELMALLVELLRRHRPEHFVPALRLRLQLGDQGDTVCGRIGHARVLAGVGLLNVLPVADKPLPGVRDKGACRRRGGVVGEVKLLVGHPTGPVVHLEQVPDEVAVCSFQICCHGSQDTRSFGGQ